MSPAIAGRTLDPRAPAQKESRIAAAFRETLYPKTMGQRREKWRSILRVRLIGFLDTFAIPRDMDHLLLLVCPHQVCLVSQ